MDGCVFVRFRGGVGWEVLGKTKLVWIRQVGLGVDAGKHILDAFAQGSNLKITLPGTRIALALELIKGIRLHNCRECLTVIR